MSVYNENYFSERLSADPRRDVVWQELNKFFSTYYPKNLESAVELGAAYCYWINNVSAQKKWAVDLSPVVKDFAKGNTVPMVQDASKLAFLADSSVDLVLASNFFEHFSYEDGQEIVKEILRVLRVGGRLCVLQPNFRYAYRDYFDDHTHRAIYTDTGLKNMFEDSGFGLVKSWPRLTPFSFKSSSLPTPRILIRAFLYSPIRPTAKQMALVVEKL